LIKPGIRLSLALLIGALVSACTASGNAGNRQVQPSDSLPSQVSATEKIQTALATATPRRPTATTGVAPSDTPEVSATRTATSRSTPTLSNPNTATPARKACLVQGGRIEEDSLETDLLRLPLEFRVYIPPCYELDEGQHYPVLYLFHGQSSTDDQWDRMGMDETADRLIAAGEIPPLILVMPYDRYGGQPTETKFSQAISEVLIPHIDQTYRTIPDRDHRAVGGLSRGAGWAIHFGISKWELFGALGAHSAAVFHTDAQRMRTWLGQLSPDDAPRIYMDIGDKDRPEIMRSALWFEELLNTYDIAHEWRLFSGYHAEEYWKAHLEQYLRWYAQGWWTEDVKLQYHFMLDAYNDVRK
jgi:enterochelin esterase-like enzyme